MAREEFREQRVELLSLRVVETLEEFILDVVGVQLQFIEALASSRRQGDEILSPVCGIRLAVYMMRGLESVHDGVDVVAVQTKAAAKFGLAERPVLIQCGENGEVGACADRHPHTCESSSQRRHLAGLPGGQGAQTRGRSYLVADLTHAHTLTVGHPNDVRYVGNTNVGVANDIVQQNVTWNPTNDQ